MQNQLNEKTTQLNETRAQLNEKMTELNKTRAQLNEKTTQLEAIKTYMGENRDIPEEVKRSFNIVNTPMRRQNSERHFQFPQVDLDTLSLKSEKKNVSSKYNYIFEKSSIINNDKDMDYIFSLFKKKIKKIIFIINAII